MTTQPSSSAPAAAIGTGRSPVVRRSPLAIILAVLAIGGAACGGSEATDGATLLVSVDSVNGVPHVRSAGAPERWRLDSTLALADAGGEPFGRVTGVAGDWKGGVYVADAVARRIYRFGADGGYLGALGGSGAGPGEFRDMQGLAWVAGRLASLDAGNGRITLLAADGVDAPLSVRWQPLSGDVALEQTRPGEAYAPIAVPSATKGRLDRAYVRLIGAGVPDTLPEYAAPVTAASAVTCVSEERIGSFSIPFAARPYAARAPEQRTVVGSTGVYRLALLGADGDTLRVIERDLPAVPVSDAEWAEAEARWARFREENRGARCDASSISRPASKPFFRGVLWDDRGRLWVEAVAPTGFRFDVYDSTGVLVGELPAPQRDQSVPVAIRSGRLFWVAADSLGVQTVRVGRIVDRLVAPDAGAGGH